MAGVDFVHTDGDLDMAFGNGGQNRLYLNDGSGSFAAAARNSLPRVSQLNAVELGDIDGDGWTCVSDCNDRASSCTDDCTADADADGGHRWVLPVERAEEAGP